MLLLPSQEADENTGQFRPFPSEEEDRKVGKYVM